MSDPEHPTVISTYFALPLQSTTNPADYKFQYYDATLAPTGDEFNCRSQGGNTDFVMVRVTYEPTPPSGYAVIEDALLYAAVARTRESGGLQMPALLAAEEGGASVSIPVYPNTTRSTLLIFTNEAGDLFSTPDPEIKNSTG